MHLAFARGTARQFGLPWAVDVSPWFQSTITDYSTSQLWKANSDPHGGHSLSMCVYTQQHSSGHFVF